MTFVRKLWASIVLVVGLRVARACVTVGMWFARKGDRIGTRVLTYVHHHLQPVAVDQTQDAAPRNDEHDDNETPNDRPPCPGCGRPPGTGHEPNCAII